MKVPVLTLSIRFVCPMHHIACTQALQNNNGKIMVQKQRTNTQAQ